MPPQGKLSCLRTQPSFRHPHFQPFHAPEPLADSPSPLPQALRYALWFYDAQRSGALPRPYRVAWRNSSHPSDAVVGGYYDAGDFIKHSLTTAQASTFLAWAALDFVTGFNASELQIVPFDVGWGRGRQGPDGLPCAALAELLSLPPVHSAPRPPPDLLLPVLLALRCAPAGGQLAYAQATVRNMASYLAACHISTDQYVGLIGDPGQHFYQVCMYCIQRPSGAADAWSNALTRSKCQLDGHIHSCSPLTSLQTCLGVALLIPPNPCLLRHTDVDHNYWGRPEQQETWLRSRNSLPRKAYIWTRAMAASDLMGMVRGEWRLLVMRDTWGPLPSRQRGVTASRPANKEVPAGWHLLSRAGPGSACWPVGHPGCVHAEELPRPPAPGSPACPPFAVQRSHDICQHAAEGHQSSLFCRFTKQGPGAVRLGQEQAG